MLFAKQSTAATVDIGPALDSAGAEYTGLVIGDLTISKNGTRAAMASAATLTHAANGIYTLVMTTGNTDTLGRLQITCNKSTYQVPQMQITVLTAKVFDSIVAGSDNLEVDAIQLLGTAIATPTTAGLMDVNSKQFGGATVTATTSVTIPGSSTLATTTGAVGSVTGAVASVTGAVGSVTGNVGGNVTGSVGSVVGAVGSVTGLTAANLDTTVSSRMATYTQPTGFLAATFPVTVASTSNITSVAGCAVTSIATDAISAASMSAAGVTKIQSGLATPTNITAITGNITGNLSGSVGSVTGAVGSVTGAVGSVTGAVTVGTISADVITASALATSAVNEIADQVWDELLSGHTGVGSTGAGLSAAGAAGDPWSTALPGSYGAGTAGKIVGDNVNATISSRASQTSLDTLDDYVDTEVGAIKTKTDQLTFTVANQIDANVLTGGGSGLTAAQTRSALGMATANLDTQIATLATPTNITSASGIAVSSIGANVITASALATDAVSEIQSGLATPTNITAATGIVLSPVTHTGARIPNVTLTDTATSLTNAASNGDLTATMKSSVTSAVPTAAQNFAAVLTTALTESYAADGSAPTLAQAILLIQQSLHEFSISSTTRTVKKLDGSTTAATFTLDSATAPTSTTRAT